MNVTREGVNWETVNAMHCRITSAADDTDTLIMTLREQIIQEREM